jgi:uncharacterized protein (TIGR02246 family)
MKFAGRVMAVVGLGLAVAAAGSLRAKSASSDGQHEIEAFNDEFGRAEQRMDNAAVMALWADDGVSLLPGMAPITGKRTISRWMDDIVSQMQGYRMVKAENEFHDIQVAGDWASEWAMTHQIVQPPDGKPPIESHGKMLLVLHREKNGDWKIKQEMWNAGERK